MYTAGVQNIPLAKQRSEMLYGTASHFCGNIRNWYVARVEDRRVYVNLVLIP